MAQARVNDFFTIKKRSHVAHPSKRRKIESADLESKADVITEAAIKSVKGTETERLCVLSHQRTKKATPRSKQKVTPSAGSRTKGTARKKQPSAGQVTISEAFAKSSGSSSNNDSQDVLRNSEVVEEVTSYWDEHDGPKTPKDKIRPSDSYETPISDCRERESTHRRKAIARRTVTDRTTPTKEKTNEEDKAARGRALAQNFRKMFASHSADSTDLDEKKVSDGGVVSVLYPSPSTSRPDGCPTLDTKEPMPSDIKGPMPSEEDIAQLLEPTHPVPISPLPPTPQGLRSAKPVSATVTSPKMKSTMERLKELQKADAGSAEVEPVQKTVASKRKVLTPKEMRQQLAKCGKLDTLKAKLAEMNHSLQAARKMEAERKNAEAEVDLGPVGKATVKGKATSAVPPEKKTVPAYERYEHLAREGPPSLALPGKYQRLLTMFQGSDTVVSMFFNRQEIITFSKLQTAVQSMTRKNFEKDTLGQMKTVYPDAYTFRQEKGLPMFGRKVSGYQLTVEPNMKGLGKESCMDNDGKANMSAQVLLKRKRIFHNTLVNITKDHHSSFLSKLDPPIEVPSSKLTRWHPRFALDSVPDIEVAELPSPPIQKTKTAKEVLESARGKLPPRVEQAMARVAKTAESTQPKASTSTEQQKTAASPNTSKSSLSLDYRGIPLSLLEKIRAKEAAKTKAALTRDPKEDKKTEMIRRLPKLIRSLRTFYVTEKKPCLPYRTVVDKLVDSYDTFISTMEVQAHLVLLLELVPSWIQMIEITRGKFIKIDKNMDINKIITELDNLVKSRS